MLLLASLLCGFVFGCGLLISGMVSPTKVLAFLDVFGDWDPSLAVVMAPAVTVTWIGFRIAARQGTQVAEAGQRQGGDGHVASAGQTNIDPAQLEPAPTESEGRSGAPAMRRCASASWMRATAARRSSLACSAW